MTIRVRFAPSPTGNLHIGTLRVALFNWLFAKANNGKMILRIEDTDKLRSKKEYEENIYEGIDWLGLDCDEGPKEGGECVFYRQSERIREGLYKKLAEDLVKKNLAYYCFLTDEDLEREKESAKKKGIAYIHSRRSSEMTTEEVQESLDQGKAYAIRFKMTENKLIKFKDLVRDEIEFDCSLLSDFVLLKSDGSPSYNFAVVVDDALMKITHVIRGEDHISNMPRQIALYEAMGFDLPQFAHLPMILGPDKSKLSKRHGATAITHYRDRGFMKNSFMNYLALLGWSPKDEKELLSSDELIKQFSLDRVHKSGAVFDIQKLLWMNGQYIRRYQDKALFDNVFSFISEENKIKLETYSEKKQYLAINAIRDNLDVYSDINVYLDVFLESEDSYLEMVSKCDFSDQEKEVVSLFLSLTKSSEATRSDQFAVLLNDACEQLSLGKGKVFKPIRKALTARNSGPMITDLLEFFGEEIIVKRFSNLLK
jgi:nondiscriminating glutamyl-tRNA synthetase